MNSEDRIIKARAKLMKGNVGMATMLLNLELIEASERCETMATDGVNIYWNDEFVKTLTDEEIQAVLVHEASHVIWEHPLRLAKRNHMIWNIATDYVINAWLKYDLRMELPKDGLLDRRYQGMSADAVYRTLSNDDEALQEINDTPKLVDSYIDAVDTDLDKDIIKSKGFLNPDIIIADNRLPGDAFGVDVVRSVQKELKSKIKFIHLNHTNPLLNDNSNATKKINEQGFSVAHFKEIITL